MTESIVWVVGLYRGEGVHWEFMGVFSEHGKAVAACRNANYFIGPAKLDAPLPEETTEWSGDYYPLAESVDG